MSTHSKFRLIIRTPEQEVIDREVESVYLTTETGDLMFLPGHAAFSGSISYSPIIFKDHEHEEAYVGSRGVVFFSNTRNECYVLCQQVDLKDRVDYDGLKVYLKLVEEHIARGDSLSDIHMRFLQDQKLALVQEIEANGK